MLLFVPHKVFSYFIGLVWASIGARAFGGRVGGIFRKMGNNFLSTLLGKVGEAAGKGNSEYFLLFGF